MATIVTVKMTAMEFDLARKFIERDEVNDGISWKEAQDKNDVDKLRELQRHQHERDIMRRVFSGT